MKKTDKNLVPRFFAYLGVMGLMTVIAAHLIGDGLLRVFFTKEENDWN